MKTEAEVKKQIIKLLKSLPGQKHYVSISGASRKGKTIEGQPDITGCYRGRYFALEIKEQGWKPPGKGTTRWKHYQDQLEQIEQIRVAGGLAGFCLSVDDVIDLLEVK